MASDNHAPPTANAADDPESERLRIQRRIEQRRQMMENSLRRQKLMYERDAARETFLLRQAERRKLQQQVARVAAEQGPGDEKPDAHHSDDFTSVVWYGTEYHFSRGMPADSVKALWAQWEKSPGLGLHAGTILETLDATIDRDRFRLPMVFRDHPAWGTMIVPAGKGIYKLASPPEKAEQSPKRPRRRINEKSTQKRR